MELTTAKKYLLLTERIGKKPMLRTRFTAQAYFVLAALFDLVDQGVLEIGDVISIKDDQKFAELPDYLNIFKSELTDEIQQGHDMPTQLAIITSWDIANQIYDGLGTGLFADGLVDKKLVKTNLDTHAIYLPTDAARRQVRDYLRHQIDGAKVNQDAISLMLILSELDALKWVFTDKDELANLAAAFQQKVDGYAFYAKEKALAKVAQDVITKKKFWYDSWLS
ncbi:hypothetical protein [Lentilactobacillus parakefiri]|uniref:GPP34 family phosphoprotein n=1 Tax=Lentilactobacillus parakefiri TaxID=152332 RepID=A0A224VFH8_9LACO|nr:hypothetical protein [Lentilactobacillus parakefiri]PAL01006.1 hypothetical protein B8W96_03640 [Lentilactobacillus parakefiri]TDG93408.1 hypothetical protein C5L28_000319 [Lentilactobacillus parakefiri]GAW71084.1 hypothetical protein LPKJCM_00155 [Lentilactobacillus parakefiri]